MNSIVKRVVLLMFALLLALSSIMNVNIPALATESEYPIDSLNGKYKTQGRVSIVDGILMLDWSASGIEFIADCTGDIKVTFDSSRSKAFFTVIVDGVVQHAEDRIPADGDWSVIKYPFYISKTGESTFTIAENLSKGQHHIEIYSQNEWSNGTFGIKSITLNGTFLQPPANKSLYIETVGDSISAGYGNLGKKGTDYISTVQQDATRGFTYLTARNLNADWSIVARSGICASTWDGKGDSIAMDTLYLTQRGRADMSSSYTFSRQPDVILVSLGSNDEAKYANAGATAAECKQGYVNFINILKTKNPKSKIIWLYGMINENTGSNDKITGAVSAAGGDSKGIYALRLPRNIQGGENHPDLATQTVYADTITAYINEVLKEDNSENNGGADNNSSSTNVVKKTLPVYSGGKDYAYNAVVIRDSKPYSIKEKGIVITEKDISGSHKYTIRTELKSNSQFYFSGKIKFTHANAALASPTFGIRSTVDVAFAGEQINIGRSGSYYNKTAIFPYKFEMNKEYSFVFESTISTVSLWVNGELIINEFKLPYANSGKAPNITVNFPQAAGYLKDVHIWSDDIPDLKYTTSTGDDAAYTDISKSDAKSNEKVVAVDSEPGNNSMLFAYLCLAIAVVVMAGVVFYVVKKIKGGSM